MKKLFLLLAGLGIMTACNETKPTPTPTPTPTPGGEPTINITEIKGKKALADTVHVIISNYSGEVVIEPKNENFALVVDSETIPGTLILSSFTAGSTEINFVCGTKTFNVPATFDKLVTVQLFTKPTLEAFGKTVEEVKALEVARGNEYLSQQEQNGILFLNFTVNNPVEYAESGEETTYVFKVVSPGTYGLCQQCTVMSIYGNGENAEDYSTLAWGSTTESNYYGGENDDNQSIALTLDFAHWILYQAGKLNDGSWVYIAHYLENSEAGSAPQKAVEVIPSMNNFKAISPIAKKW